MMRITNSMMTSNTKNNINLNKLNEDNVNTKMATGQKITRPSDDPVIAIRALRLNTNIGQLNQYYDKNIPDADAWLKVTETALSQTDEVFNRIKENLTTGASDTNTADDRLKILTNLQGLRKEVYSAGNADYAGRTVFTGYRTGQPLTFLSTDTDMKASYDIHQILSASDVDSITYVTSADREAEDGTFKELNVESKEVYRIRLPYDSIAAAGCSVTIDGNEITPTVSSIVGLSQAQIDDIYAGIDNESTDPQMIMIPETGEILINKAAKDAIEAGSDISVDYTKNSWQTGDLRPEHYYACKKTEVGASAPVFYNYDYTVDASTGERTYTDPNFVNQDIQVEISFNQKISINTNANEVYTHDIGRDVDDLLKATQDVVDLDETIAKLKTELSKATDTSVPSKADIQAKLDAANKEHALKRDKMQKMFSNALDKFDGYAERNNQAIADIGSLSSRLKITKERVADQLQSFKELADDNINISITDTAIDLSSAELALQAAQMAASKIAQQTLLNYL